MDYLFIRGFFFSMGISYYTKEGLDKLRSELNHLKDVERPNASKAIAEARDKGDLSENAEYDAAKEAQGLLELKISKLDVTKVGGQNFGKFSANIFSFKFLRFEGLLITLTPKSTAFSKIIVFTIKE